MVSDISADISSMFNMLGYGYMDDLNAADQLVEHRKREARYNFKTYMELMYPGYVDGEHVRKIREALEAVERRDINRLILSVPPRHSKSMHVSEGFPSWYLGRHPDHRIIAASHTQRLAETFSRRVRNQVTSSFWPFPWVGIAPDNGGVGQWGVDAQGGGYLAVGVGGSPTGQGGDCWCAGTPVLTDHGTLPIEDLHRRHDGIRAASFNHESGEVEYMPIVASREVMSDDIWEVQTGDGRRLRATGDHRVFVEGYGYRPIRELARGDRLVSVRGMWEGVREEAARGEEGRAPREEHPLLLNEVQEPRGEQDSAEGVDEEVPRVWWMGAKESNELLFGGVPEGERCEEVVGNCELPPLRSGISEKAKGSDLLFRRLSSLGEQDDWVQETGEIPNAVQEDQAANSGEGQLSLCDLFQGEGGSPSHQRTGGRQRPGKPNLRLSEMPSSGSLGSDFVVSVERIGIEPLPVYDIQVEKNHNFFAEEILSHNCIIIDDPIKSVEDAESPVMREKLWEWYQGTLYTRRQPGAAIVITQTRWHEDDLVGRVLEQQAGGGDSWEVLNFPAQNPDGTFLWEDFWPPEEYLLAKRSSTRVWNSQYMGSPSTEGGNLLKEPWFRPITQMSQYSRIVVAYDTADKVGLTNDFTACVIIGIHPAGYDILHVHQIRVEFPDLIRDIDTHMSWAMASFGGAPVSLVIEDAASGRSAIQYLKSSRPNYAIYAALSTRKNEKEMRVIDITPLVETGRVFVPANALWKRDFFSQITQFPYDKHDDMVDAFTIGLRHAAGIGESTGSGMSIRRYGEEDSASGLSYERRRRHLRGD